MSMVKYASNYIIKPISGLFDATSKALRKWRRYYQNKLSAEMVLTIRTLPTMEQRSEN